MNALEYAVNSSAGIFVDSCLIHCQTLDDKPWSTYAVGGRTMRDAFQDWYFERSESIQTIDCPFPCNPTCPVDGVNTGFISRGHPFIIATLIILAVPYLII